MSILKTHNTRRTLQAMAERHRKDARTLAMLQAEALLEPSNGGGALAFGVYSLQVCVVDLKKVIDGLENLTEPEAPKGAE